MNNTRHNITKKPEKTNITQACIFFGGFWVLGYFLGIVVFCGGWCWLLVWCGSCRVFKVGGVRGIRKKSKINK